MDQNLAIYQTAFQSWCRKATPALKECRQRFPQLTEVSRRTGIELAAVITQVVIQTHLGPGGSGNF